MTISLNGTYGRFTQEYLDQNFRKNQEKQDLETLKIKSQLVGKTFEEIKQIIENIGDHPNPNLLIENLETKPFFDEILTIVAEVIKNSTYSVDKILNINN